MDLGVMDLTLRYRAIAAMLCFLFAASIGPVRAHAIQVVVYGPQGDAGTIVLPAVTAAFGNVKSLITSSCSGVVPIAPGIVADGSEDFDAYVSATPQPAVAGVAVPPLIKIIIVDVQHNRAPIGAPVTFSASALVPNFCSKFLTDGLGEAVDSAKFFDLVPDTDADRAYTASLVYQLQQYGLDGRVASVDYPDSQSLLDATCGSKRGVLHFHVNQGTVQVQTLGATQVLTAVSGAVLKCGQTFNLDTMWAPQQSQYHFISLGTLVSTLVGLAVALKPKISTPQLTTAIPLFSAFINDPDSLPTTEQQAISSAFGKMIYTYCVDAAAAAAPAANGPCKSGYQPPAKTSKLRLRFSLF